MKVRYDIIYLNSENKILNIKILFLKENKRKDNKKCTHTHTHTGYIREINKKAQKKNIKLFSNMLFCHTLKKYVKIMYC